MSVPIPSRQLDQIFEDLAQSAATATDAAAFAAVLAESALLATGALGAAVWAAENGADVVLLHDAQLADDRSEHLALLAAQTRRPQTARDQHGPLLVATPICERDRHHGAVARGVLVLSVPNDAPTDFTLETALALAELGGDFFRDRTAARLRSEIEQLRQLSAFTLQLHRLPTAAVPYEVVNELPQLIDCDRAFLLVGSRRASRVVAATGAGALDSRSETVLAATQVGQQSLLIEEPVWPDDSIVPQIQEAVERYCDIAHARFVAAFPLWGLDQRPLGAVVLDWLDREPTIEERSRIETTLRHAEGPLRPSCSTPWSSLRRWLTERSRAMVLLGLSLLIGIWLLAQPTPFYVRAKGIVQPANRRRVFAPADGLVKTLHVAHGDDIQAGAPLFDLENPSLERELAALEGREQTLAARLKVLELELLNASSSTLEASQAAEQLAAEERLANTQLEGVRREIAMLQQQLKTLESTSPIAGRVVSWNVQRDWRRRPLRRGQAVLRIDQNHGPWEVELQLPESSYGQLQTLIDRSSIDLPIEYRLASAPESSYTAALCEIGSRTELDASQRAYVRAIASTDKGQWASPPRTGASVHARIHCGERSRAYVWFHEVIDYMRRKFFL